MGLACSRTGYELQCNNRQITVALSLQNPLVPVARPHSPRDSQHFHIGILELIRYFPFDKFAEKERK